MIERHTSYSRLSSFRNQQAQVDWIRRKLTRPEEGGFTTLTKEEIRKEAKSRLNEQLHNKQ